MAKVKVSDCIAKFLEDQGLGHIFVVSGGGNVHMLDSISNSKKLKYICHHHEQAAAMAAEAYARISKNFGACLVTFGPGSTNAVTGTTGAWLDSIPVLYLSGQVSIGQMMTGTKLRQLGVQEINIVDIVRPVTKYAVVVSDPNDIKYHLQKALFLAKTGRPGPVWLDIPMNIQSSFVEENGLRIFDPQSEGLKEKPDTLKLKEQVLELIKMIKQAKRPLIFAGHGIHLARAEKLFLEVVEKLNIPVVTSMSAHDLLPTDHFLFAGRPAVFGDRAGNFAVQNTDLLIAIGAMLHLWNIGYNYQDFARNAKKVMVDIDEEELKKKTVIPNFSINADAKDFLKMLKEGLEGQALPNVSAWLNKCSGWKEKYPVILPQYKEEKDYVNSYFFIGELSDALKEGDVIFTGVGASFTGTSQSIKIKSKQTFVCNVGCAAMGYDLPAAIGACFANNKKRVILIVGEGGIMMNLQELQTIYHHHLPIKIFLLNNNGYLSIKNTQNNYFHRHYVASDPESGISFPDFEKVAKAFSIRHVKVNDNSEVAKIIQETLADDEPILCEINMSPKQPLYPRLFAEMKPDGTFEARPLEDMYPFIDREEFKQNMTNN